MATDKEILQKLFKIARNQQKIIKKLAATSVKETINNIIAVAKETHPILEGVVCTDASEQPSAVLLIGVSVPDKSMGDQVKQKIIEVVKPQFQQYSVYVNIN